MEAIRTTATVRGGKITVDVDAPDGTPVEVVIKSHRHTEEEILAQTDRFREETRGTAVGHTTIRKWIEEGRA